MLSDLFSVRYACQPILEEVTQAEYSLFCKQAWQIIYQDMMNLIPSSDRDRFWRSVTLQMRREVGVSYLFQVVTYNYEMRTVELYEELEGLITNEWTDRKQFPCQNDCLHRIDAVEMLLRLIGLVWQGVAAENRRRGNRSLLEIPRKDKIFADAIREINVRANRAGLNIHFHNGIFQLGTDPGTEAQIAEPFWDLMADPAWKNVDDDMKEACDLRDRAAGDSILFATRALESALKIISDQTGRTRGGERGMANYIDNLVREQDGSRFIELWEKVMLDGVRDELRNKHGHGPGSKPAPNRTPEQIDFAIDLCMAWVKSLKRRVR